MASRGVGAICMEATSVVPEGRISPEDAVSLLALGYCLRLLKIEQGLWTDSQMEPLKRIVNFVHAQGTKIGVQLAHAGRKASTYAPWVRERAGVRNTTVSIEENGWPNEGSRTVFPVGQNSICVLNSRWS